MKAGEELYLQPKTKTGLLYIASVWQRQVDVGRQLKFPQHITKTSLWPDMIIISEMTKQQIMLELKVKSVWKKPMRENAQSTRNWWRSARSDARRPVASP